MFFFMYDRLPECALQMYEVSLLNISDNYQVIERIRFCEEQTNEQKQGENIHAGVMFFVNDMSAECIQMYEVPMKYL